MSVRVSWGSVKRTWVRLCALRRAGRHRYGGRWVCLFLTPKGIYIEVSEEMLPSRSASARWGCLAGDKRKGRAMQRFRDYSFQGKRVIIRVDFNVPFDKRTGLVTDDSRIRRALPTIEYVVNRGGRVVLMSHMGRPKGKPVDEFSMKRIKQLVEQLVGKSVALAGDCVGPEVEAQTRGLHDGEVLLLENVRFHAAEEGKVARWEDESEESYSARKAEMKAAQRKLAEGMARLGDCYVNDAFGAAHRAHASTTTIAEFFPNDKMFGLLMESELEALSRVEESPKRPLTAIMGGAKVSDKITLIENLLGKVDRLIIGGGMTYTFVKAQGGAIGKSLCEPDFVELAGQLLAKAKRAGVEVLLPVDAVCADAFAADANTQVTAVDATPEGWMGLDIGPKSCERFRDAIATSGTVFWNGPMGVFEMQPFAAGTMQVASALAEATRRGAFTLVGGGDSVSALKQSGRVDGVSYVSTGGGAMLEYLEGKELPGVKAIRG